MIVIILFYPTGELSQIEKDMKKILVETFKKTDEEFLKEATKTWFTLIYLIDISVVCINYFDYIIC